MNKTINFLKKHKIIIGIILASFALSLCYSFYFKIKPSVDAGAYDVIAQNLINGRGYRENLSKDIMHDYVIVRVGPLYEFFLAGIYFLFGHSYGAVWIFHAILRALTVLLVYLTAFLVFQEQEESVRKKIALWAAGIIGFYPDLIEISAMLMIEIFYLFLFCLALYCFFKYLDNANTHLGLALGVVFGLAVLARPPVLFLLPVVLFYFFIKKRFWMAISFLIIILVVFTPWTVRNYKVYGKIMPFGVAGNINFWIGNYHGGDGEQESNEEQNMEQANFLASHKISEVNNESMRQFFKFLRDYPAEFIKLTFLRVNKYFSIIRPMGFWFYQKGLGQFLFLLSSAAASVILFVFGLGGVMKTIMEKKTVLYYLLAFTIVTPLIIFITVVETRYRFQIYPLLAIFAGYFIVELFGENIFWKNRILWISALIIFLNGALDLFLSFNRFRERLGRFF